MRASRLTKKMLKVLEDGDVCAKTRKMKVAGLCCGDVIWLNPHKPDILNTFVHELVHFLHPEYTEKQVEKTAWKWEFDSTWNEKRAILQELILI